MNEASNVFPHTPEEKERAAKFAHIVATLAEDARKHGAKPFPTGEQFVEGLNLIVELYRRGDASEEKAMEAVNLAEVLLYDHENFYERFFDVVGASDNPVRVKAEQLLRTGKVTTETTFGELPGILAENDGTAA